MNRGRIIFIAFLLAALFITLGGYAYDLQIRKHAYYLAKAAARRSEPNTLESRGTIYGRDANGAAAPFAQVKQYPIVFANPSSVDDVSETSHALALLLRRNEAAIEALLKKSNDSYERIAEKVTPAEADVVRDARLAGVYVDSAPFRFYPFGTLASQVIGYVGLNDSDSGQSGKYGTEKGYEDILHAGRDVHLTIDRTIQAQVEAILRKTAEKFAASGGSVIVEEPKTGRILALANTPDFDPNEYGNFPLASFTNPAVQSIYEAGSVFKVITMAAGLDTGAITPESTYIDRGSLTLNGYTIKNWDLKAHGKLTMTQVLEESVNTGAAFAESRVGHKRFYDYLVRFGFDETTGISLPGEVRSKIYNLAKNIRDINFATASFGQGIAVTPIALVNAVAAIANDGVLMRPFVDEAAGPETVRRVISEKAAKEVTAMMVSAVDKAKVAAIPGYTIAGKTGTAQISNSKSGGYFQDQFEHTYIGFGPAADPAFIILFKLDRPNVDLAGGTVVPAFRELAEFLLNYLRIPPDKPTHP